VNREGGKRKQWIRETGKINQGIVGLNFAKRKFMTADNLIT
jgi:hypothetical protein